MDAYLEAQEGQQPAQVRARTQKSCVSNPDSPSIRAHAPASPLINSGHQFGSWEPGTVQSLSWSECPPHVPLWMLRVLLCVDIDAEHKLETRLALIGQDLGNLDTGSLPYQLTLGHAFLSQDWGPVRVCCSNSATCLSSFCTSISFRFLSKNWNLRFSSSGEITSQMTNNLYPDTQALFPSWSGHQHDLCAFENLDEGGHVIKWWAAAICGAFICSTLSHWMPSLCQAL